MKTRRDFENAAQSLRGRTEEAATPKGRDWRKEALRRKLCENHRCSDENRTPFIWCDRCRVQKPRALHIAQ
ncbi:MAG: hypothetical protein C4334_02085 [Pyrinomonas sp.]